MSHLWSSQSPAMRTRVFKPSNLVVTSQAWATWDAGGSAIRKTLCLGCWVLAKARRSGRAFNQFQVSHRCSVHVLMYQLVHKGTCTPVCAGVAGKAQMAKLRSSTSLSCAAWLARWTPDASRTFMMLTPEAPRA